MSDWLRRCLYSTFGLLWLSGLLWLALHFFFQRVSDFGAAPNPWQPPLMAVHGVLAVIGIFLFGWIAGSHIGDHWQRRIRRITGLALIGLVAVLAATGLGSYYLTSETWRAITSAVHEGIGAVAIVPALVHWFGEDDAICSVGR